jgi:lipopolysaccharide/colanic/teichoic acid biosynthesis glycosyltransferase
MTMHQSLLVGDDAEIRGRAAGRAWNPHVSDSMQSVLLGLLGVSLAIGGPALLAAEGIGMSRQVGKDVFDTATAAFFAIICSLVVSRRLLFFPLLRTSTYVAVTFLASFALVAVCMKFFRINFSSPQFFLSMVIMAGFVEGYLAAQRRWKPRHIVVVPGGTVPAELPRTLSSPIRMTALSAIPGHTLAYSGVVADLSCDLAPEWERFLAVSALRGIPVYHVKQFNESITGRVAVDHLWENTLGAIVPSLIYPQFKRTLDFIATLLLLPFIGPIIAVAAVLIRRETPGPVFYRQQRIGLGGKPFTIVKLRTMTHAAEAGQGGSAYTLEADPRITRVGRFLRKYRLDELPQVINILRGEMSWIGPRPEAIPLAAWYERDVAFYVYRHIVRPGISGWAQVNQGNVAKVDAARKKLEYDFFYIKHFSLWLDIVIFVKTLRTIITGDGAR